MIDLALSSPYLLGAALVIGIVTGRWAFSSRKAPPTPETPTKQEDESAS